MTEEVFYDRQHGQQWVIIFQDKGNWYKIPIWYLEQSSLKDRMSTYPYWRHGEKIFQGLKELVLLHITDINSFKLYNHD